MWPLVLLLIPAWWVVGLYETKKHATDSTTENRNKSKGADRGYDTKSADSTTANRNKSKGADRGYDTKSEDTRRKAAE